MNAEAPQNPTHTEFRRQDYRPPDWLVPAIALDFDLGIETTRVKATLTVERNGGHDRPLRLDGDEIQPLAVRVDGQDADWSMDGDTLVVAVAGDRARVETEVAIYPASNSKLMGLYASNGMLCTQCEAEGFRRITFFPDRPDVLSRYAVRMTGDKAAFPILLTNGNPLRTGEDGARHWAEWEDPFPKPSYLFALVAGDLKPNHDSFTTRSGRKVDLNIWVREADLPRTGHAMAALKQSMAWDEETYGREYDLDLFNIVAVSDFNMGAMENKGLNVFNTAYVLADPDTATDTDFDNIARVVAHEYFHNWSGNRVTCRDWFQLSLKEGFTVFRDQGFSADTGSPAVKRIDDVRTLRAIQFPEDSGPLAHSVRPDSYVEISNFYTATVYNKGAELIRMMRTILGPDKFRAGTDLYFDRHDGEAATCDDFVKALEDASGVDLTHLKLWYSQAGTPKVTASLDQDGGTAVLKLAQTVPPTPGHPVKQPMPIPLKVALIGERSGAEIAPERLVILDAADDTVEFDGLDEPALLSINRGFSAPVDLQVDRRAGELEKLAASDSDPFARYEAIQELMMRWLIAAAQGEVADIEPVIRAVGDTLRSNQLDAALKAEAILPPSEAVIGDRMDRVDPDAIHGARERLRAAIGARLSDELSSAQREGGAPGSDLSSRAKGTRRLRSIALDFLAAADAQAGARLAKVQFDAADNMTDRSGALRVLASLDMPERVAALEAFYRRHADDPLVIDKWFGVQAMAQRPDALDQVRELIRHERFTFANPNRLRSVAGVFGMNQWALHHASGEGYRFLTDLILEADKVNPQVAARMVPPLGRWKRFDDQRQALMREQLERIVATPGLSKDVHEQASKSLGG
ncbi:aminopeptidase N [Sphingomonas sabuli]|uniref:Aminopeptidase N n=1 Tax=Sphingomonas sabuli TaxID=2764186 RepID=A0A7G9L1A7_9SPHN|nr:aminopeptidase N [Sphingomonas sabuli]QNM82406.1 aminopeptidase N [Sphingomonas sabuli]